MGGKVPEDLEELAYKIGCAYMAELKAREIVVGYDTPLSLKTREREQYQSDDF